MRALDGHNALVRRGLDGRFNKDFGCDPRELYMNFPFIDQLLRNFIVRRSNVCQGLQTFLTVAGNHTESGRENVADFIGVRNATGKGVLIHTRVHGHHNALDGTMRVAARFCRCKSDCTGLCYAERGLHIFLDHLG